MGVRTVNPDNIVEFHEVDILKDEVDGIWVTGLPDITKIIVVGQQLVVAGELVSTTHGLLNLVGGARKSENPAL
jgi:multidrug efflux system membrane fusion protein